MARSPQIIDPALRELENREAFYAADQIIADTWAGSGPGGTPADEIGRLRTTSAVDDPADTTPAVLFGLDVGQLALLGILGLAIWGALDG